MNWVDLRSDTVTQSDRGHARRDGERRGRRRRVRRRSDRQRARSTRRGTDRLRRVVVRSERHDVESAGVAHHCGRGDEYIAGQQSHTYKFEGGGGAVFGGIQPQPLPFQIRWDARSRRGRGSDQAGRLPLRKDAVAVPREHAGRPAVAARLRADALVRCAIARKLALHLDGARLFNAAVSQRVAASRR